MAPEVSCFIFLIVGIPELSHCQILLEQRYGRAVDWWAFGVLMYEMLLGQSPFRGDDEDEIFDAILEDEPLYPITMPRDAVSILQKVCHMWPPEFARFLTNSSFLHEILRGGWALARLMQKKLNDTHSLKMSASTT